jgi:hypothetical protein
MIPSLQQPSVHLCAGHRTVIDAADALRCNPPLQLLGLLAYIFPALLYS